MRKRSSRFCVSRRAASRWVFGGAVAALLMSGLGVRGQDRKDQDRKDRGKAAPQVSASQAPASQAKENRSRPSTVTAAQEAAVMTLVGEHHTDLQQLLVQLKRSRPKQYESAVRQLFRTSVRLAAIGERDPVRYELELARWKLESRLNLLSAKLSHSGATPELERELRATMTELVSLRLKGLQADRDRQQQRLLRVQQEIDKLTNIELAVDREVEQVLKKTRGLSKGSPRPSTPVSRPTKQGARED